MTQLWVILALLVAAPTLVALMIVGATIKAIKEVGLFKLIILLMIGRHHSGHHHTNATFWRDSNGKIVGHARYHLAPRYHRAGYKNLARTLIGLWVFVLIIYGLWMDWLITVILVAFTLLGLSVLWGIKTVRKVRRWHNNKTLVSPMAKGLAQITDQAESDVEKAIVFRKDWQGIEKGDIGTITFPDTFIGTDGIKETVEGFVERRIPKPVELSWQDKAPVTLIIKADLPWPKSVLFRDHLDEIEACPPGTYIGGYNKNRNPEILDHTKDFPMKGYCMNTGTGKTVRTLVTAAQILHNDPECEFIGFDVKQVSLLALKGIPGVTIYDDPFNMQAMWDGWYAIKADMDERYRLKKAGIQTVFPIKWVWLEEGNTFGILIKAFYLNEIRAKGEPAAAKIWYEAIAPILFQGREVGIFVNGMFQNFMEKYFGNMSLRPAFSTIGMAGFKPPQYRTIIGSNTVPAIQRGQGRMLICEPDREVWVQGLYDQEEYLIEYAKDGRQAA